MYFCALSHRNIKIGKHRFGGRGVTFSLGGFGSVFKQIVDVFYLSIIRYTAAVDFNWQFVKTGSAKHLILIAKLP